MAGESMVSEGTFTTRTEVEHYLTLMDQFEVRARAIAAEYAEITEPDYKAEDAHFEYVEDGKVFFSWWAHRNENYLAFPLRYMWEENWQDNLRAELAGNARRRKQEVEDRKRQDKLKREQDRRALYEQLKREYEP